MAPGWWMYAAADDRLAEQFFDDNDVAPYSVELGVSLVHSHLAESNGSQQRTTRRVFNEDP